MHCRRQAKCVLWCTNLLGHEVAILVDRSKPAGDHTVRFGADNLASGLYVYRLQAQGKTIVRTDDTGEVSRWRPNIAQGGYRMPFVQNRPVRYLIHAFGLPHAVRTSPAVSAGHADPRISLINSGIRRE